MSEAPKGKRLLFDPANTGIQSFEDFKTKAKEGALREAVEAIDGLSDVPNSRRTDHVRTTHLDQNARKARQLSSLNIDTNRAAELKVKSPQSLRNRLRDYASSLDKTGQALVKMSEEKALRSVAPIALPHLGGSVRDASSGEAQ